MSMRRALQVRAFAREKSVIPRPTNFRLGIR